MAGGGKKRVAAIVEVGSGDAGGEWERKGEERWEGREEELEEGEEEENGGDDGGVEEGEEGGESLLRW